MPGAGGALELVAGVPVLVGEVFTRWTEGCATAPVRVLTRIWERHETFPGVGAQTFLVVTFAKPKILVVAATAVALAVAGFVVA